MPDASPTNSARRSGPTGLEEPIKVCLLGATGAGKTCFIAGLAFLSEPDRASIITVLHDNKSTADYLDSLQDTLRSGHWPPPNNATFILDMTVIVEGRAIDLRIVDYPGEDFTNALRTLDTAEIDELYRFSKQAQIFLLLFSPHRDLNPNDASTVTATLLARQQAHLQAIFQVWKERKLGTPGEEKHSRPVELGLVVTQCDRVPGLTSPRAAKKFFKSRAPNLLTKLTELADSADFFGISVLGRPAEGDGTQITTTNSPPPEQLGPFGYEPLFLWISNYSVRQRRRRLLPWIIGTVCTLSIGLVLCYAVWQDDAKRKQEIIANKVLPPIEIIRETSGPYNDTATTKKRADYIRDTLQQLESRIGQANTPDAFQTIDREFKELAGVDTDSFRVQVENLQDSLRTREILVVFNALKDDFQSRPRPSDFQNRALAFIDRYGSGENVAAVRQMLRELRLEDLRVHRTRLKGMPTRDSLDIGAKSRQIFEFVTDYESDLGPDEASRIRRAADLARSFSERKSWDVTIKKSGGLTADYAQSVLLGRNKLGDDQIHVFDGHSTGETKDKVWTTAPAVFSWQAGEPITMTLKFEGYVNDGWVAYQIDDSSLAIGSLIGRRNLSVRTGWDSYVRNPYVEFQVKNLSSSDWEVVKSYISPGTEW